MLNFQVPQFIEVEDKIFGPLTFRQFIYLGGGAALAFIFWALIPWRFLAVLLAIPAIGLALALAFYKVNNRPFIAILESAFHYALTHKLYIWKRTTPGVTPNKPSTETPKPTGLNIPKLSASKLKDLAWSLDIKEKIK